MAGLMVPKKHGRMQDDSRYIYMGKGNNMFTTNCSEHVVTIHSIDDEKKARFVAQYMKLAGELLQLPNKSRSPSHQ